MFLYLFLLNMACHILHSTDNVFGIRVHPPGNYKILIYSKIDEIGLKNRKIDVDHYFATVNWNSAKFLKKAAVFELRGKFEFNDFIELTTDAEGNVDLEMQPKILEQGKFLPSENVKSFHSGLLHDANLQVHIFPLINGEPIPLCESCPCRNQKIWDKVRNISILSKGKHDDINSNNPILEQSVGQIQNSALDKQLNYNGEPPVYLATAITEFVQEQQLAKQQMEKQQEASSSSSSSNQNRVPQMTEGMTFVYFLLGLKPILPLSPAKLFFTEAYIVGPLVRECDLGHFDLFVTIGCLFPLNLFRSYMRTEQIKHGERIKECFKTNALLLLSKNQKLFLTENEWNFFKYYLNEEEENINENKKSAVQMLEKSTANIKNSIKQWWMTGAGTSQNAHKFEPLLDKKQYSMIHGNEPIPSELSSLTSWPMLKSVEVPVQLINWIQILKKACIEEPSDWSPPPAPLVMGFQQQPLLVMDADLRMLTAMAPAETEHSGKLKEECLRKQTLLRTIRSMWNKCEKFERESNVWNGTEMEQALKKITNLQLRKCMEKMALFSIEKGETTKLTDDQRSLVLKFIEFRGADVEIVKQRMSQAVAKSCPPQKFETST